jgi:hypothetical protein
MSTKTKQQLPKWFHGELYDKGDTVRNRFSGEEYKNLEKVLTGLENTTLKLI